MAFRDDLVGLVDEIRSDLLDTELGMRLYTVETVLRTWSGARPGDGTVTDTATTLDPPPRVRAPHGRQQDSGREQRADLVLSKISATLAESALTGGSLAANQRFYWRVTPAGGSAGYYWLQGLPEKRFLEWRVKLRALRPLEAVSVSTTVTTPTAQAINAASGVRSATETATAVTGWVAPERFDETGDDEDLVQRRRITLHVLVDELPERPTVSSRFTLDGRTYRILSVDLDAYGLYWALTGEASS